MTNNKTSCEGSGFYEMAKKSDNLMEIDMLEFFDKRRIETLTDDELTDEIKKMAMSENKTGKRILKCPKCGHPQYCGCASCIAAGLLPDEVKPWVITDDGYVCGNCGFEMSDDAWLDEVSKQGLYDDILKQIGDI